MSNKSSNTSQTITLPQGGGALQGVGETFAPDLHTGTGNFTVPIALPPGRNGFQPQINLVYSTGAGNGPFGLGWNLDVPGISRKTSRGIPRYEDNSSAASYDTFVLSGAEDLVLVGETDTSVRYRPRTEGLFARIEHRTGEQTNHWEVRSKDGLVSYYGAPGSKGEDQAVITDPGDRSKIFAWRLTRTADPFGNQIVYEYERDSAETSEHYWDQLYLKRILYADYNLPGEADLPPRFLVSVSLIYDERPDPFSEYRAGFEIRTRKRCLRLEIRTHAETELLVRTYHFVYLDQRGQRPERLPLNAVSLLNQVVVEGHDSESSESLPPLEFGYSTFEPSRRRYQPLSAVNHSVPGRSLENSEYELVDLFGNGLPDVIQMNGTTRYWRNLGNGRFDLPRTMESAPPLVQLNDPGVQLADANGNGRADLIVLGGLQNGYYPLTFDGGWNRRGFVPYRSAPLVNLDAPDVRLMDLDGDGVTDALRTGPNFELYYNNPEEGWSRVEVRERVDSDLFPNVTFGDPRVKLGDLTGDGLQQIVLIHNGRVEYWPYLGYGRWARRVTMRNSPRFEDAAFYAGTGYDPKRLLLGDVDGDGAADLVYVSSGHITVWINQGGNAWSDPITIHGTPPVTDSSAVRLADMLGNGTDGILWTYDFAAFHDSAYKFLDLTGGIKPYLLREMDNHLGATTKVSYAPSTEFYLKDQERPETRWKAPLPFPVQVVARAEVIDQISRGKLTTEYRYHQGYWDGVEREFRGFGMVEQFDTQTFSDYHAPSDTAFESVPAHHFSPPTLTRTWFHQGPVIEENGDWQELDWSADYWPGDLQALAHTQIVNSFLRSLPHQRAKRDALRTLRGSVLRSELYALDGSDREHRPYTVTEHAYGIREESSPGVDDEKRLHIFFPHPVAQRSTQWERGDDPMTQFTFTGDYDIYGQPRSQVSLAVPRGRDYRVAAAAADPYLGVETVTTYAQRDDDQRYIVNRVCGSFAFEIINDGRQPVLELYNTVHSGSAQRSLIAQSFNYYDGEAFVGLPHEELGDYGVPARTETLALTEEILRAAHGDASGIPPYLEPGGAPAWTDEYPGEFRDFIKPLAGYTFADGSDHRARGYFVQSTRVAYDFQLPQFNSRRGLPLRMRDPLGNDSSTVYDQFQLLPLGVTDAAGLTTVAEYDYRAMQPRATTDPNGNRTRYSFTPLGLLKETFVMGKAGVNEGDLEQPGTHFFYDFLAFDERRQPVSVRAIRREHHDTETDVEPTARDATIEAVEYSDGFGRVIQTRTQAEDVIFAETVLPADQADQPGTLAAITGRRRAPAAEPNVVVSGWQVYDNKGRVVEKYEPFFSIGWSYAPPADAQLGRKVKMFYDPRGQVIRTVNPDGSEQRVIYGVPENIADPEVFHATPWEAYTYDANDNAVRTHPEESSGYQHHWNTPAGIVIDALGRTVLAIACNRSSQQESTQEYRTRSTYDIRGNLLTVTDALDREAFIYVYDLADNALRIASIDAGVRRVVHDAAGNEVDGRDSKGSLILQAYDALNRPTHVWARDDGLSQITLRRVIEYGDGGSANQGAAEREANRRANRLGRLHRHYDEAGRTTVKTYDFKGNVLEKTREVISDAELLSVFTPASPQQTYLINWQPNAGQSLEERAVSLLDSRSYQTSVAYDALNRAKAIRYPLDQDGERKAMRPRYNNAGALERVELDEQVYVAHIAYNAKGQRLLLALGNGVMTRHCYDAQTLRLRRLRSESYTRPDDLTFQPSGALLQDFAYEYDLAGNILRITDRVPGCGVRDNADAGTDVDPALRILIAAGDALVRRFEYDAIYRLTSATGRESKSLSRPTPWHDDLQRGGFNSPNHGTADQDNAPSLTSIYKETYAYDPSGNMIRLRHTNGSNSFVRQFSLAPGNNRLHSVTIGQSEFAYTHDANGNMTSETASRHFAWDHSDQMKSFRVQAGTAEPSVHALYLYDAAGMRVKKLVRKQGGQLESSIYVDEVFEHHRWQAGNATGENNYLHVMDDQQRIAQVRVGSAHPDDRGPAVQYHLGDHLGSSGVVVDRNGSFINREEYAPYGETSFGGFARKRYRFTGKERDEESGFCYYSARYYAPWILRWISADPLGLAIDSRARAGNRDKERGAGTDRRASGVRFTQLMGLFVFNLNNPLRYTDRDGREPRINKIEPPEGSFKGVGFQRSLVDERKLTSLEGEDVGEVTAGKFEFKFGFDLGEEAKREFAGIEVHLTALDIEVGDRFFAGVTVLEGTGAAGRYREGWGARVQVTAFEAKAGGNLSFGSLDAKASVTFGLSIGVGFTKGKGKLGFSAKAGIGFELEVVYDWEEVLQNSPSGNAAEVPLPPEEWSVQEKHRREVTQKEAPPPPVRPRNPNRREAPLSQPDAFELEWMRAIQDVVTR